MSARWRCACSQIWLEVNVSPGEATDLDEAVREVRRLLAGVFREPKSAGTGEGQLEPLRRTFCDAGRWERHPGLPLTLASSVRLIVGELGGRMGLAPATTSLLAGELRLAGFLFRREDDEDRRRTILSLPDGLEAPLVEFANASAEPLRRMLEQLRPAAWFLEGRRVFPVEATRQSG